MWTTILDRVRTYHLDGKLTGGLHLQEEGQEEDSAKKAGSFEVTPVADAVCPQAFHTVLKMTQTMLEEKNWGVLTQAMGALQQMFGAVQRCVCGHSHCCC